MDIIIHDAPSTTPEPAECVFREIIAGCGPASVVCEWPEAIAIRPRHPVTPGHVLVIPHTHVADGAAAPDVSARTMAAAALLVGELKAANVFTCRGAATQTARHLHLVPRQHGDGLPLPWPPSTPPEPPDAPNSRTLDHRLVPTNPSRPTGPAGSRPMRLFRRPAKGGMTA